MGIALAGPEPRRALGFRRFWWAWIFAGLVILFLAVAVSAALEPILHASEKQGLAPKEWRPERAGAFAINAIVVVGLAPFTEELFYRGLGITLFARFGPVAAVAATAFAFAVAHGIVAAIPPLLFFALLLGWLRIRSGSVWPCFLTHAAYNGAALAAAFVAG